MLGSLDASGARGQRLLWPKALQDAVKYSTHRSATDNQSSSSASGTATFRSSFNVCPSST